MRGSTVKNVKFRSDKQKLVRCDACGSEMVVGKFAKRNQVCDNCKNIPKGKDAIKIAGKIPEEERPANFMARLGDLAQKLGYTINDKRIWHKKYAIDGGGVVNIHAMIDPGVVGAKPKLDYFSLTIQRAINTNEDFRQFMPPDAASDCELLASEFGDKEIVKHDIGKERCDGCGVLTEEFGVDTSTGKILCVRPNGCFRKKFTSGGAESHE